MENQLNQLFHGVQFNLHINLAVPWWPQRLLNICRPTKSWKPIVQQTSQAEVLKMEKKKAIAEVKTLEIYFQIFYMNSFE